RLPPPRLRPIRVVPKHLSRRTRYLRLLARYRVIEAIDRRLAAHRGPAAIRVERELDPRVAELCWSCPGRKPRRMSGQHGACREPIAPGRVRCLTVPALPESW